MAYRSLSFRRVYRWLTRLAAREPQRIVGNAKDPWSCPLVTYLRQRNPHTDPYVNAHAYSLYPKGALDDPTDPLPNYFATLEEWAQYFVANIDDLATERCPNARGDTAVPITAKEALEVLHHWHKMVSPRAPKEPKACTICGQRGGRLVPSYCGDVHPACAQKNERAGGIVR